MKMGNTFWIQTLYTKTTVN